MNPSLSTAFGYIRVSTHMQEELSPDAQKREIQRWADAHKIQILRWFQDTGISGKKASNRSDFQQMISLAKEAAHPDYILTWKFSRFARNQEESIVYKSLLRKNNVQVISVSEPLPDGPFSSLIERIIEWMDEYYSIRLSGEVRRGMMEKALSGGYQSPPPLGYQKTPGTLIPQVYEPEAAIYRQIKEYALAGRSPTSIARLLNSQGLRTKRGHAFDSRSIRYILQNPFYAGKVRWTPGVSSGCQAESTASMSSDTPRTSVILSDGRHTPLCTTAEWKMSAPSSRQKTTTGGAVPLPAPTTSAAACFAALTVVLP
ncbi:MAG: recombinase family protein [Eubacterium sp.]